MRQKQFHIILLFLLITPISSAQVTTILNNFEVSSSIVVKLGHSKPVRELTRKSKSSINKLKRNKLNKSVPDNFKGRRDRSKAIHFDIEHQGPDPIRQKEISTDKIISTPILNFDGIGDSASPHDPTGDVSDKYYVQMVNKTQIGVFNMDGGLISQFEANTLWTEFSQQSSGDPIVLYDENVERWILTEFSSPANILIAVSDNWDPLGSYSVYNFSTPSFPDYPKYGLSPNILTFTSNEEGGGELHNYFIDLNGLYAGDDEVKMQRIRVDGNNSTEAGFYVTTPVDWNGVEAPFDNRAITLLMNDSSWDGGPAQDQIEVFSFDIDFNNSGLSEVTKTVITTTSFDSYPCSESGFEFACIPQKGGSGLDGVPEVIMNMPHLRNFGTYESMVLSFITDATDGENISGIRWMELRRINAEADWKLYQEGTFAPEDGIHRFLPSIAIDAKGSIGLAYNVSSPDMYVGARYTGRNVSDPLGQMTIEEVTIVEGKDVIYSGERFGDYSQMSISPKGDNTFWWTSEYAGAGSQVTQTRIVAFKITRDSVDLSMKSIDNPSTGSGLTTSEEVSISILNSGLFTMSNFTISLLFEDSILESKIVTQSLDPDSIIEIAFETKLDLSKIGNYKIGAIIKAENDKNLYNDTLFTEIRNLHHLEANLSGVIDQGGCSDTTLTYITVLNDGADIIDSLSISVLVNDFKTDTIRAVHSFSFQESIEITYESLMLSPGLNTVDISIISVNGQANDDVLDNNSITLTTDQLPADHFITINFKTDKFPEENGWSLYSQGTGELIASGILDEVETTISTNVCVNPDSCFTFIVSDAYGDGLCCNYGNGNFNILDNEGNFIVSNNGKFGELLEIEFCGRGMACTLEFKAMATDASSANAKDGIILVEVLNGLEPYQYSIDGGETFQNNPIFKDLSPGEHIITVVNGNKLCETSATISVGFASSIIDIQGNLAEVRLSPNPTKDIFKINISNLAISDPMLSIDILNLSGQILQHRKISKYNDVYKGTISLMPYPEGVYLIRIHHSSFNFMQKVVKNKL